MVRWKPSSGHIPRGYLGATGALEDVKLIMVFSQPGHPYPEHSYDPEIGADELIEQSVPHTYSCFSGVRGVFHRNARWFIDQIYPNLSFKDQLRHVWLTEERLCSIDKTTGPTMDRTCAEHYLKRQVDMLPNADVVAFGDKAKKYLQGVGIQYIGAYALAPPGARA